MPEGVVILTAGKALTSVGSFFLALGLIVGLILLILLLYMWDDTGLGFKIIAPIIICLFFGLAIFGGTRNEPYQKIMLTDNAKFSEVAEYYDITSVDGQILTVKEKAK